MPNETERVASTSKSDRDSVLREQLFRAALAGSSPSDPFAHIPMSAISERLGEAESSLLYQFDTSDGSDALTAFRAAAYVRAVERLRASVDSAVTNRVIESLARGDALSEVIAQFFDALCNQFESDPAARYVLGSVSRLGLVPGLEQAVKGAWSRLTASVHDVIALVAAAHGQKLQLDPARLSELVAVSIAAGWVQRNLVSELSFDRVEFDTARFGPSGFIFWAGLRPHMTPYSEASKSDLEEVEDLGHFVQSGPLSPNTALGARALDAAVDVLNDDPGTLPLNRSIMSVCKSAGVGASTFYRLFTDVEAFRQGLVRFHVNTEFRESDPASAAHLASSSRSERQTSVSDREAASVIGSASAVLVEATSQIGIDGEYIPWIGVPLVADALRDSYKMSERAHAGSTASYLEATGRGLLDTVSEEDFMRRLISVSIGFGLTPYENRWSTSASDDVCIATYLHVALANHMTTPLFPQCLD